ncbi:hypothetical protein [Sabulicella glaciei]|uniref:Uncharacterized protein n=1 Tax=Sabulicella glaciei TaxID=2984948 RepID=A0ABT3NQ31_9PROT|nr:hypothetical protein [Roseococcus sp. MDT2-1-1]MCW8084275.1 hypothetical protein [Roseococcus sp. MDT2-1-1]
MDAQTGQVKNVVTLQYNPDTLSRSLQIKGVGGDGAEFSEALRLKGPPVETIKLEAEIDATDKLEAGDATAQQLGLHAQLAQFEALVYPSTGTLRSNNAEASSGSLEIVTANKDLLLFVWSRTRILPVRITEFSVSEEGFDAALNPLRAKLSIGMRVLTVDDLTFDSRGGSIFMSYLEQKEQLASRVASTALRFLGISAIP